VLVVINGLRHFPVHVHHPQISELLSKLNVEQPLLTPIVFGLGLAKKKLVDLDSAVPAGGDWLP